MTSPRFQGRFLYSIVQKTGHFECKILGHMSESRSCPAFETSDFTLFSTRTVENFNLGFGNTGRDIEQWHLQFLSQSSKEVIFGLSNSEIANHLAISQVLTKMQLRNISGDSKLPYTVLRLARKELRNEASVVFMAFLCLL